jgi:hypothetical protein
MNTLEIGSSCENAQIVERFGGFEAEETSTDHDGLADIGTFRVR